MAPTPALLPQLIIFFLFRLFHAVDCCLLFKKWTSSLWRWFRAFWFRPGPEATSFCQRASQGEKHRLWSVSVFVLLLFLYFDPVFGPGTIFWSASKFCDLIALVERSIFYSYISDVLEKFLDFFWEIRETEPRFCSLLFPDLFFPFFMRHACAGMIAIIK